MVLAGPGSGKTSVIVERTAYMINEGKIPASSILVVTFSRAAATEMKERFLKFVGQNRSEVTFGTFHGIFYGILKAAYHLSAANILSEEEASTGGLEKLPTDLLDACSEMKKDNLLKELVGDRVFDQYYESKIAAWKEYDSQVTNWEIESYLYKF